MTRITREKKEAAIRRRFLLDGEDVYDTESCQHVIGSPSEGYLKAAVGQIDGKPYAEYLHRIKWCLKFGVLPCEIDHKDRDRQNNLFDNLRLVNRTLNNLNRTRKGSRVAGVEKRGNRYRARLEAYGVRRSLGSYATEEEASQVYQAALAELYSNTPTLQTD